MAKGGHNVTLKKAMLEALRKSLGIVSTACKSVGVERPSHYRWMKEDPNYASAVAELDNVVLDFAESSLHKLIKEGDTTATIFFLKTKGKKRGYIERTEADQPKVPIINIIMPNE
jgi:hypothetical protein